VGAWDLGKKRLENGENHDSVLLLLAHPHYINTPQMLHMAFEREVVLNIHHWIEMYEQQQLFNENAKEDDIPLLNSEVRPMLICALGPHYVRAPLEGSQVGSHMIICHTSVTWERYSPVLYIPH